MAATYRSSVSTNTGATAAGSITVNVPAGIQVHDVLISMIGHDGGVSSTISTPSGWTVLRTGSSAAAGIRAHMFWRLADGSEPASYTWNFDTTRQASGTIVAYSGASITIPPSNSSASLTAANTALTGSSTTATYETGMALQFFVSRNTIAATTQTAGGSYVKREDTCTTASVFIGLTAQEQARTLPIGATASAGNTCTTASTSVCYSLFIDDARPAFLPLAIDEVTANSISTSGSTITMASLQTNVPNVTLLAFVSINNTTATVSSIASAGLTWVLVSRANAATGCVEVWSAAAITPTSVATSTITFSTSVFSANAIFAGFIGADFSGTNGSAAIGAKTSSTMAGSAPSVSLTTTRNNSWVWAITNSTTTNTITVGSGQTLERSQVDSTNVAESFMWRQTSYFNIPAGTTVTLNATAPSAATGNILAVEILAAQTHNLSALGSG